MSRSALAPAPKRIPRRPPAPRAVPPVAPRPRHLRVVDTDALKVQQRRRWLVRFGALGVASAALAGVVAHSLMAESQLQVIAVAKESAAEQRRYEEARLEVARLESPAAVMQRATALGLVPAGGARIVAVPNTQTNATVDAGDVPGATQAWQAIKGIMGATR